MYNSGGTYGDCTAAVGDAAAVSDHAGVELDHAGAKIGDAADGTGEYTLKKALAQVTDVHKDVMMQAS